MTGIESKATAKRVLSEDLRTSIREQLTDGTHSKIIAAETGATLKQVAAIQANITIAVRKKRLTDDEMLKRAHNYAKARARARAKGRKCLTLSDCKDLWEMQEGCCDISGKPFSDLMVNTRATILSRPWRPSLDRINSKRGYERSNVRLVAQIVNFGLNEWPLNVFREMCERVTNRKSAA